MLIFALPLQWLTFAGLYRVIFGFAVVMVFTDIVIKSAAAFIQLFVKEPKNKAERHRRQNFQGSVFSSHFTMKRKS